MLKAIKTFYKANKTIILVVVIAYALYKFRGIFNIGGSLVDAAASGVSGATAGVVAAGEDAADKVKIKTVNPNATPADLQKFRDDARAIAGALGNIPGVYSNMVFNDTVGALNIAKKYSKYLYRVGNDGIVYFIDKDGNGVLKQKTAVQRKLALQLPVLYPFYQELTKGRSLLQDLDAACNGMGVDRDIPFIWRTFVKP